ncbi:MAG TPA: hypothetical protein VIW45_08840 [Vicinamibacterales bacterium]|jgi:hypothetical protein
MLARSQKELFARLIDYAGLFPPAALPMEQAVANYARYRDGEHAWMLGKFVVPQALCHPERSEGPASSLAKTDLSILGIDEVKEIPADPHGIVYVEVTDLSLIKVLAERGLRAKIRTGGVTADAFPTVDRIAAFIRECAAYGVPFKATAGLHHPIRCVRPLTYEPDAPRGTMHGFVNVFLAAALIDHAEEILMETDAGAFAFDDDTASWRGHRIATSDLARVRNEFAISFGSCSFDEPVADLKDLGWL